jgi:hypothetical protein
MDNNLIAACGIDCANCELFEANGNTAVWQRAAERLGKKIDDVMCKGCRINKGCVIHADCKTYACVTAKGHEFCFECGEFPCRFLMPAADGAGFYPHNLKMYNLGRIKALGPKAFLAEAPSNRARYYRGRIIIGEGPQDPVE